jgi:hypothetical protein
MATPRTIGIPKRINVQMPVSRTLALPRSNLFRIFESRLRNNVHTARSFTVGLIALPKRLGPTLFAEKDVNRRGGRRLMPYLTKLFGVTFSDADHRDATGAEVEAVLPGRMEDA